MTEGKKAMVFAAIVLNIAGIIQLQLKYTQINCN